MCHIATRRQDQRNEAKTGLLKTCGCIVENLWVGCARATIPRENRATSYGRQVWTRIRGNLRLRDGHGSVESRVGSIRSRVFLHNGLRVHRFSEIIGGRTFHIEVSRVGRDRWRANIVRMPGIPAALMPFYGATPDDAAKHLAEWLQRAHRTAHPSTPAPS